MHPGTNIRCKKLSTCYGMTIKASAKKEEVQKLEFFFLSISTTVQITIYEMQYYLNMNFNYQQIIDTTVPLAGLCNYFSITNIDNF